MTVKTWFVLSALAIAALFVAFAVWIFRPIPTPEIILGVGDTRVEGAMVSACWPQRGGGLECEESDEQPEAAEIPASGNMRVVVLFPAQPDEGSIVVTDGRGRTVLDTEWEREIEYSLEPGTYTLEAQAAYPEGASLHYGFRLTVS